METLNPVRLGMETLNIINFEKIIEMRTYLKIDERAEK